MSELHHECGIAAVYHLPSDSVSPLCTEAGAEEASRLMPRMLLDIQNRGQLAAGLTSYNHHRNQLIDTYKEIGTVSEVFRLSHRGKSESLMNEYAGRAAIGHVRYATCGQDDRSYERVPGLRAQIVARLVILLVAALLVNFVSVLVRVKGVINHGSDKEEVKAAANVRGVPKVV